METASWAKLAAGLITTLLLAACTSNGAPTATKPVSCAFGVPATVLLSEGPSDAPDSRLLRRLDLVDGPIWESTADPRTAAYRAFREQALARAGDTDPARLLASSPTINNKLVLEKARDWIRPATCLEKLLYGDQHARVPTFSAPTEFAAFALRSADKRTLRVYSYTVNRNGIGNATPLTDPVRTDVRGGWQLLFALHSHPFAPGDRATNGILAPSVPDAHFGLNLAKSAGLPEARITNGINTVRIPSSAFPSFQIEEGEPSH